MFTGASTSILIPKVLKCQVGTCIIFLTYFPGADLDLLNKRIAFIYLFCIQNFVQAYASHARGDPGSGPGRAGKPKLLAAAGFISRRAEAAISGSLHSGLK
jgi:hypothetical protein